MYHMVKLLYSGCGQVEQERCLPSSLSLFNQLVHVLCLSLSIAAAPLPRTWSGGRAPPATCSLSHSQPLSCGFVDYVRTEKVPPDSGLLSCRHLSARIPLSDLGHSHSLAVSFPISQMGTTGPSNFEVLPGLATSFEGSCCVPRRLADLLVILGSSEDS